MRRHYVIALVLLIATLPLLAQSSPQPPATQPPAASNPEKTESAPPAPFSVPNLFGSFINLGLQGVDEFGGRSSKFQEYRDVPDGLTGPNFRVFNDKGGAPFLVSGQNVGQSDRRFYLWTDLPGVRIDAMYDQIPHRLGDDARSVEKIVARDALGISDYIQRSMQTALEQQFAANKAGINYAFLRSIAEPVLNTPERFDLGFQRDRALLNFRIFPDSKVTTNISYFEENRSGTRSAGSSFGFGNVVETPEPVDYRTREAGVRAEMPVGGLLMRGSLSINQFDDQYHSYTFDNPFRVTDSTDPSAYTAPGSGSINGAATGRLATPPDNSRVLVALGGVYKMPKSSRLTADLAWGQMRSDNSLMPYTTNSAILATVPQANYLPVQGFEGKINTTSLNLQFTTTPVKDLNLSARYRFYDSDNRSPRITFPGYVRFDAVWEPIPRITVPYSWRNNRAELLASYDFGSAVSVEGGVRNDVMHRTFRETERTTENIAHLALDLRPFTWVTWRNSFEFGNRSYDQYDTEASEDASQAAPASPVNQPDLRRFDQAERSTQRIVSILTLNPFDGPVDVTLNYVRYFDDYSKHSDMGLQKWRNQSFNAEADYTPGDRWNLFAFYSNEVLDGFQIGRQSGATPSVNPLDNWYADNSDKANTFGAGANLNVVPDRWDLRVSARIQNVNGYAGLSAPAGGVTNGAVPIPNVDDTRFWTTLAEATYRASAAWNMAFGAWYEGYRINDALNTGTQQYLPGGFFLAPNDLGYRGLVAYVSTTYRW